MTLIISASGDISSLASKIRPYAETVDSIAALPNCVSLAVMRDSTQYTTTALGAISAAVNLADGANNFVQPTGGRQPLMVQDDILGQKSAQYQSDYTSYMTAQQPFDYTVAHTLFAVFRVAHNSAKLYQTIMGRFAASAPERSAIVVRDTGNAAALYGSAVPLPSAKYRSARWGVAMLACDGLGGVKFRMGNSQWLTATAATEPGAGTTILNLGYNASGGSTVSGFIDLAGAFDIDLSASANAATFRKVFDMVSNKYGSVVPICGR